MTRDGALRRAALFIVAGVGLSSAARSFLPPGWAEALAFVADVGLLVALASLAWKPQARWPLVLVALQGLIVALDGLRAVEPHLRPSTFLIATWLVRVGLLATLVRAAWGSRRGRSLSS